MCDSSGYGTREECFSILCVNGLITVRATVRIFMALAVTVAASGPITGVILSVATSTLTAVTVTASKLTVAGMATAGTVVTCTKPNNVLIAVTVTVVGWQPSK